MVSTGKSRDTIKLDKRTDQVEFGKNHWGCNGKRDGAKRGISIRAGYTVRMANAIQMQMKES